MADMDKIDDLEEVFRQVFRRMAKQFNKHVDQGISGPQAAILERLESQGRQRVSDLADMLSITPAAVTSLCDKLVAGKYACRKRTETDRRIVYLEITDKGSETLQKVQKLRKEIMAAFCKGLSEEDIEHLIRIHHQILANID
jgi:DNA-binding MarR family transcriptional regulator